MAVSPTLSELLNAIPSAGKELPGGGFTKGSIYDRVNKALDKMAQQIKATGDENDKAEKNSKQKKKK